MKERSGLDKPQLVNEEADCGLQAGGTNLSCFQSFHSRSSDYNHSLKARGELRGAPEQTLDSIMAR